LFFFFLQPIILLEVVVAVFQPPNKQIFPSLDLDNFDIIWSKSNTSSVHIAAFQEQGAGKCLNCSLIPIPVTLEGLHRIGKKLI